jgi:hypothetical protein
MSARKVLLKLGRRSWMLSCLVVHLLLPNTSLAVERPPASTTVLGQSCKDPYVVAIPAAQPQLLDKVQALIPTAFLSISQFGRYVLAASYDNWSAAELLNRQLRQQGLDARILYKPLPCGVTIAPD